MIQKINKVFRHKYFLEPAALQLTAQFSMLAVPTELYTIGSEIAAKGDLLIHCSPTCCISSA